MALISPPGSAVTEPFWFLVNREDTQRLFIFTGNLTHDQFSVIERKAAEHAHALRYNVNSVLHRPESLNEKETLEILNTTKVLLKHIFDDV
jgi:hypothetical protein